jgi:hypothetical protein
LDAEETVQFNEWERTPEEFASPSIVDEVRIDYIDGHSIWLTPIEYRKLFAWVREHPPHTSKAECPLAYCLWRME